MDGKPDKETIEDQHATDSDWSNAMHTAREEFASSTESPSESSIMKHVLGAACMLSHENNDDEQDKVSKFDVYIVNGSGKVNGYELKHISPIEDLESESLQGDSFVDGIRSFHFDRKDRSVPPKELYGRRSRGSAVKSDSKATLASKGSHDPIILEISDISSAYNADESEEEPNIHQAHTKDQKYRKNKSDRMNNVMYLNDMHDEFPLPQLDNEESDSLSTNDSYCSVNGVLCDMLEHTISPCDSSCRSSNKNNSSGSSYCSLNKSNSSSLEEKTICDSRHNHEFKGPTSVNLLSEGLKIPVEGEVVIINQGADKDVLRELGISSTCKLMQGPYDIMADSSKSTNGFNMTPDNTNGSDTNEPNAIRDAISEIQAQVFGGTTAIKKIGLNNPSQSILSGGKPTPDFGCVDRELKTALLAAFIPSIDAPSDTCSSKASFVETSFTRRANEDELNEVRAQIESEKQLASNQKASSDVKENENMILFIEVKDSADKKLNASFTRNNRVGKLVKFFEELGEDNEENKLD
ncbi:hypothetical protein OCOL_000068 [Ordospora colligata]|uniref:Uncharacterized protein n=1 Tax=Ordospora colligata OC4 TaxID=1354746 RepID=A0A0B2UKB4_9MICR|nr:uncharacterized protein M896_051520 [Ordospora colligata OC4]KHN69743.1 hypothetical protein M896_051520 [Ordospora colligata OC4]